MKKFNYEAKDSASGKVVKATVQADTEMAAAKVLIEQGFMPLDIVEVDENRSLVAKLTGRIAAKDKIVFSRQLATLIGAGLPLSQSLYTVLDQTSNKRLQSVVQDIVASVEGGKSLTEAFSKFPGVFDGVFLALISAGEASGTLDDSLKRIAAQQEKDAAIMSKIRGALTYPIIVLVVIFAVIAFMLFTVVPQVERLYDDLNKTLPFITQVLVVAASILMTYWWAVFLVLGVGSYFFVQFLKTDTGMLMQDTLKLNAPMFGAMYRKLYMARFTRTGQTLLSTGVAMLDMLRITGDAVNNKVIHSTLDRASEKVKSGKTLSSALQSEQYILPLVPQMIHIGEQSGKIDDMMGKTAQVYEDELEEEIKTISTLIEPLLMVVLAVIAGSMVAAILLPIYSLVNGVSG